jgi:acetate---CoA ligase (ADP-forming)
MSVTQVSIAATAAGAAGTTARTEADALFRPRSIAIIGASSDATRIGGRPIDYTRRGRFAGALYPVNPNQSEIQGIPAWASVTAIPGEVDLALIALPAKAAPQAVDECIAKGVKAIVMFSSGFAEIDAAGRAVQDQMRDRCVNAGVLLLGPNCLGVMNIHVGMMLTFSTILESIWPNPGRVAVVSQSGAVGAYSAALAMERGIGLSQWVATGNEADIDVARCIQWLAEDKATSTIMAYMEGCRDLARLRTAFESAARHRKPVLMLKSGITDTGRSAVAAHTGSDAGDNAGYDALFRATGVYRARSIEEQVDMAYACANGVFPRGPRLSVISISGGVGVLTADAARAAGLELPSPGAETQREIKQLIPFSSPVNPVDVTAQIINDMGLFNRILALVAQESVFDSVIIFLQQLGKVEKHFHGFRDAMLAARCNHPEKLFVLCGGYSAEARTEMEAAGFLIFEDPARAANAVGGLTRLNQGFARFGAETKSKQKET